jgi:hypothetical protein
LAVKRRIRGAAQRRGRRRGQRQPSDRSLADPPLRAHSVEVPVARLNQGADVEIIELEGIQRGHVARKVHLEDGPSTVEAAAIGRAVEVSVSALDQFTRSRAVAAGKDVKSRKVACRINPEDRALVVHAITERHPVNVSVRRVDQAPEGKDRLAGGE